MSRKQPWAVEQFWFPYTGYEEHMSNLRQYDDWWTKGIVTTMPRVEITYKQVERPIQKVVMSGRMLTSEAETDSFPRCRLLAGFTCSFAIDHLPMSLEQAHEIQRLCVDGKRLKITLEVID